MVYGSFCRNPFSITTKFFMRNFAVVVFVIYLLQENKKKIRKNLNNKKYFKKLLARNKIKENCTKPTEQHTSSSSLCM